MILRFIDLEISKEIPKSQNPEITKSLVVYVRFKIRRLPVVLLFDGNGRTGTLRSDSFYLEKYLLFDLIYQR
jgi:hypothetical protein